MPHDDNELEDVKIDPYKKPNDFKVENFNPADSTSDDEEDSQSSVKKMRAEVRDHQNENELRVVLQSISKSIFCYFWHSFLF